MINDAKSPLRIFYVSRVEGIALLGIRKLGNRLYDGWREINRRVGQCFSILLEEVILDYRAKTCNH